MDHSQESEKKDADYNGVLDKASYYVGTKETVVHMPNVPAKPPFADDVIDFLNDLSKELMRSPEAKSFPDVVTLGFWLRKSAVMKQKERFALHGQNMLIGRGVAFHIAPSNVPVNYAYSLFTGLICGNANIVRIPSRDFPQVSIINKAIRTALEKHEDLKPYIVLLRYDRDKDVNDVLSALCDVRLIWGGDATIAELRKSPLPPRATEITFADRYSLAVIDSNRYMAMISDKEKDKAALQLAQDFYNDTYLSDQNACTSPRTVVWTGSRKNEAKERFWNALYSLVKDKYYFQDIQGIDKLSTEYMAAASGLGGMRQMEAVDNRLVRIQVLDLSSKLMDFKGTSGYFYEYDCDDIMELRELCNNTHCQTMGILGDAEKIKPLILSGIRGVDRIVPIGHTMDFDLIWDGYNLVERLTRICRCSI
jgi:hypothetical protein